MTDAATPAPERRPRRRRALRPLLLGVLPALAALIGLYWYATSGRYVSTENAYVKADIVAVSPDVDGRVVAVEVVENQRVSKGDVLFRIDPEPFRIALERAEAQIMAVRHDIEGSRAEFHQVEAEIAEAQERVRFFEQQARRQRELEGRGISTQASLDEAEMELAASRQQMAALREKIRTVLAELGGDPASAVELHPDFREAEAERDMAALDLDDTLVVAPIDGIVSRMSLQPGEWVEEGEPAFSIVDPASLWIEANLKETQLEHVARRPAGRGRGRRLPGRGLAGRGRQHQPGDRRRVRADPAAERDRQLGQGGAAAAGADRRAAGREPAAAARRHDGRGRDRHRARAQARRAGAGRARRGPRGVVTTAVAAPPDTALQRALILLSVILATTLYATTLTIANVALPQMQGDLSASHRPDRVGPDLQHRRDRDRDAADRLARGAPRPQAPAGRRGDGLHGQHAALRPRLVAAGADPVAHLPGPVRRAAGAAVAGDHARHLPQAAARHGDGAVGRRRDARADPRADHRRLHDRALQLALGVLRRGAVRRRRGARLPGVRARQHARARPPARLVRLRRAVGRGRGDPAGVRPRPAPRLVRVRRDHALGRDRAARLLPVHRPQPDHRRAVSRHADVPRPQLRGRADPDVRVRPPGVRADGADPDHARAPERLSGADDRPAAGAARHRQHDRADPLRPPGDLVRSAADPRRRLRRAGRLDLDDGGLQPRHRDRPGVLGRACCRASASA